MKKFLSIAIIWMASVITFAQPAGVATELHKGRKCYVHIVEKGNTLYGIKTLYNVEVEEILAANEGLTNDLQIGQKIYVPMPVSSSFEAKYHVVEEGETLYGISKKYDCTVADLKRLNSGIGDGISIGQKLKVPLNGSGEYIPDDPIYEEEDEAPTYNVSLKDSVVEHHVLAHETLYSISKRYMVHQDTIRKVNKLKGSRVKKGDVLMIPLKRVNYTIIEKDINEILPDTGFVATNPTSQFKETYTVAILLPFLLEKNDAQMSKTLKLGQSREMYPTTKVAYDFYQGFRYAADSLARAGMKVNILVYDTKRDTAVVQGIFNKAEFSDVDLVIGPLYENTVKVAARLCKERELNMVLPFKSGTRVLHQNPRVFNAVTSNMTLMDGTIDYLVEEKSHCNILILNPYSESDKALYDRAVSRFNEKIKSKPGALNDKIIELSLGSSGGRDINAQLRKDTTNIFIVPSTDIKFVSGAMNRLNKVMNMNPYAKQMKCIAFGFEDWNKYDDLDVMQRNRLYQHYASYRYVDFNQKPASNFVKNYRGRFDLDPNVFSAQGFDVGMYFMSAMYLYGTGFESKIHQHTIDLIQNDFIFEAIDSGSGYENKRVCVVMYDNYLLYRLK